MSHEQPEVIILGTGTDGAAQVAAGAEIWARANNVNLPVQRSHDASVKLTELAEQKKKVAGLIDVTR